MSMLSDSGTASEKKGGATYSARRDIPPNSATAKAMPPSSVPEQVAMGKRKVEAMS